SLARHCPPALGLMWENTPRTPLVTRSFLPVRPMLSGAVITAGPLPPERSRSISSSTLPHGGVLVLREVTDDRPGYRVASQKPVPHIFTGTELDPLFLRRVHGDVLQPGGGQSLAQNLGVRNPELQWGGSSGNP